MMMRIFRLNNLVVAAAFAVLIATSSSVQAQIEKPFNITGTGIAPQGLPLPGQDARPHWIVGNANHLGLHTGAGTLKTVSADPQPNGTIAGNFGSVEDFVFTGANGDKLVCEFGRDESGEFVGDFELTIVDVLPDGSLIVEALFIAEFVPVSDECTGKFAGVTGSWTMFAYTEPFLLGSTEPIIYGWDGTGSLTFQEKK